MLVGEAEVKIKANTAGFESQLRSDTQSGFAGVGNDAEMAGKDAGSKLEKGMSGPMSSIKSMLGGLGVPESLMGGFALTGVAVAGVAAYAVDLGAKMQKADATIATTEGISVKAATNIGNAFLNTAGTTEFSGQEIASSFGKVAGQLKATEGHALSTKDSMHVMTAAMDLATAKGVSLDTATGTLASTMQAFKMPVSEAAKATDILFNVSNSTGQGIDVVGAALAKLKSRLGAVSPPLGALGTLMVDMTNQGITGRAALTGVNSAMTALVGAATGSTTANLKAKTALDAFGVSATTANGQLTPMSTIVEKLGPKFTTMTQAQQLAAATTIFGASAAKSMVAVIDAGPAAYDKATASVNKMGAAHAAATTQSHTLSVEFATVKATAMDFATQLGQQLIPIVQQLMGVVMQIVPVIGTLLKGAFQILTPIIDATIAVLKPLLKVITDLINFVVDIFTGEWTAAWKAVGKLFVDAWDTIKTFVMTIPQRVFGPLPGLIIKVFDGAGTWLFDIGKKIIEGLANGIIAFATSPITAIKNVVKGVMNIAHDALSFFGIGSGPSKSGSSGLTSDAATPRINANLLNSRHSSSEATATLTHHAAKHVIAPLSAALQQAISGTTGTTGTSHKSSSSTKMSQEEMTLQQQGMNRLAVMVTATHSKSLTALNIALDATHRQATALMVQKLDATHNSKLTSLGQKLEAEATKEEAARTAALTVIAKTGTTALNAQLTLSQSTSLTTLNTALDKTHNDALTALEKQLSAVHTTKMDNLVTQLTLVHKQALENWLQQQAVLAANGNLSNAQSAVGLQADMQTVNNDLAAMKGLTGDALTVASAQFLLDNQKYADDKQAAALQTNLNNATTAAAKAAAQAALTNFQAQAVIAEGNASSYLSQQQAQQTLDAGGAYGANGLVAAATKVAPVTITLQPGAVVINPAPGNDAASIAATQTHIANAFNSLALRMHAGMSPLAPAAL